MNAVAKMDIIPLGGAQGYIQTRSVTIRRDKRVVAMAQCVWESGVVI
jgi:hypothetical protein